MFGCGDLLFLGKLPLTSLLCSTVALSRSGICGTLKGSQWSTLALLDQPTDHPVTFVVLLESGNVTSAFLFPPTAGLALRIALWQMLLGCPRY